LAALSLRFKAAKRSQNQGVSDSKRRFYHLRHIGSKIYRIFKFLIKNNSFKAAFYGA